MNGKNMNTGRRMAVRGALVVVYVALIGVAFIMGKGHTLLLDNKDAEDGSVKAFENVTISVDGAESMDFMAGDRDMAKIRSQWHKLAITVNGQTVVRKFKVPVGLDMALLSIPKLYAGQDAVSPFVPKEEPPAPPEPDASAQTSDAPAAAPAQAPATNP